MSTAPAVAMSPSPETMAVPVPHHDVHAVEGVGVAGPAHRRDPPGTDADRDLAHAQHRVDDDDVADHHVAGLADRRGLQVQAVAGRLAEAREELVAGPLRVALDLDHEAGVAEPDAVARPRTVRGDVSPGESVVAHGVSVR